MPPADDDVVARVLHDGELEVLGRMPWSSNATYLCEVGCGEDVVRAIYKPRRGERPLWDFPSGLDHREVAAYELSTHLGWDLVPVTVRSLNSWWNISPWSMPRMRPSRPSRQWPLLRSVLLPTMSNAHMRRSAS